VKGWASSRCSECSCFAVPASTDEDLRYRISRPGFASYRSFRYVGSCYDDFRPIDESNVRSSISVMEYMTDYLLFEECYNIKVRVLVVPPRGVPIACLFADLLLPPPLWHGRTQLRVDLRSDAPLRQPLPVHLLSPVALGHRAGHHRPGCGPPGDPDPLASVPPQC
jgi:hypothetical protein